MVTWNTLPQVPPQPVNLSTNPLLTVNTNHNIMFFVCPSFAKVGPYSITPPASFTLSDAHVPLET